MDRRPAPPVVGRGHSVCGAAEVDITPAVALPMAGYSVAAERAMGYRRHLCARAIYLEDAAGNRAALCVLDMMSASRYLLERIASVTADHGISVDRLVLCGTHTHTGPGNFYGNSLYDTLAQNGGGMDLGLADWVASRAADAVIRAIACARPASVRISSVPVWGASANRSLQAFERNSHEKAHWHRVGYPGHGVPTLDDDTQRCVDPRVVVLAAHERDSAKPIALFATFGAHATALGPRGDQWESVPLYSPDWPGYAADEASTALSDGDARPVCAIGLSAAGDVSPDPKQIPASAGRAEHVGRRVGRAIAQLVQTTAPGSGDFRLETRYAEPDIFSFPVGAPADTMLAPEFAFGASALAGAEDGRSPIYPLLVREGMTNGSYPKSHPHHPKAKALGSLQKALGIRLAGLRAPRVMPLTTLRIDDHLFFTVPGEPTTAAAWRMERALCAASSAKTASAIGYAGDYIGYFTTAEEHGAQHYEGASMLYGRNSSRWVEAMHTDLARGAPPEPITASRVRFRSNGVREDFDRRGCVGPAEKPTKIGMHLNGHHLRLWWYLPRRVTLDPARGVNLRVEQLVAGQWVPVLDDVAGDIVVHRQWYPLGRLPWIASMRLPVRPSDDVRLRARLLPQPCSRGFTRAIRG